MKRVLVVDDETDLRVRFCEVLKQQSVETVEAGTGKMALQKLREGRVALVFLDIRLPDCDGMKVLQEALKIQPGLKVVMMTGYGDAHQAVSAMKLGAVEYLTKPFDIKRVQHILREQLMGGFVEVGESLLTFSEEFEKKAAEISVETKVLLVDDNETLLSLLTQVIKQIGCQVETAKDAASAKEAMARSKFELVVADVKMPGETGLDLLKWIKQYHPFPEVILITAYPTVEMITEAIRHGVFDFIVRPFPSLEDVVDTIKRALHRQLLTEQNRKLTQQIKRRNFELELLYKISNAISYTINYETLVNLIMQSLTKVIPFDVATAFLVSPEPSFSIYLNGEVSESAINRSKQQVEEALAVLSAAPPGIWENELNVVQLRFEETHHPEESKTARHPEGPETARHPERSEGSPTEILRRPFGAPQDDRTGTQPQDDGSDTRPQDDEEQTFFNVPILL